MSEAMKKASELIGDLVEDIAGLSARLERVALDLAYLHGLQPAVKKKRVRRLSFPKFKAWPGWIEKGTAVQHAAIVSRSLQAIQNFVHDSAAQLAPKKIQPTSMSLLVTMKRLEARAENTPLWHSAEELRKFQAEGIPDAVTPIHDALGQLTHEGLAMRRSKDPAQWTLTPAARDLVKEPPDLRYFQPLAAAFASLPPAEQEQLATLLQQLARPEHAGGLVGPTPGIPRIVDVYADLGRLNWLLYERGSSAAMGTTAAAALVHLSENPEGLRRTDIVTQTGLWNKHFDQLAQDRLVTPTVTDAPNHKRQVRWIVTPQGNALAAKLAQHPDQCDVVPLVGAMARLGPENSAQLARLLEQLTERCTTV